MNKTIFATILTTTLAGACAVEDAPSPTGDPRDGVYTVESEVAADAIDSEIFRDGVLVAVATLDAGEATITLVGSGKEMVAETSSDHDPRTDLQRYEGMVVDVSKALELTELDVEFRSLCSYFIFEGEYGSTCAVSWCGDGSSCMALDCGPNNSGSGEFHVMSGCD